jgi:hypothetical protein
MKRGVADNLSQEAPMTQRLVGTLDHLIEVQINWVTIWERSETGEDFAATKSVNTFNWLGFFGFSLLQSQSSKSLGPSRWGTSFNNVFHFEL